MTEKKEEVCLQNKIHRTHMYVSKRACLQGIKKNTFSRMTSMRFKI